MSDRKRFDLTSLPPEERKRNARKGHEARSKLNPGPQRKRDLQGERLRLISETTEAIKSCMGREGINYTELARRLNMTNGHVSHLMSGTRNMTLATLADISEAIGYQFTLVPLKVSDKSEPS